MGHVIGVFFLIFIGYVLALKLTLLVQGLIALIATLMLVVNSRHAELEGIVYFVIWLLFMIGMILGDLYYYSTFYNGNIDFGWFIRP